MKVSPDNSFTRMQKLRYEKGANTMAIENHSFHNENPEYWSILFGDLNKESEGNRELRVFEFGVGAGRNLMNLVDYGIGVLDGCDISRNLVEISKENIDPLLKDYQSSHLYVTNGVELNGVKSSYYDFAFSTITLQHISVYEIRRQLLEEMYRILKPSGILSIQMGYGKGKCNQYSVAYFENAYHVTATNGVFDVEVSSEDELRKDLREIGFRDISFRIGMGWENGFENWIYAKAIK